MSEPTEVSDVPCAGCRKVIALTTSISPLPRVYCSQRCLDDYPVSANESRDDKIVQLLHLGQLTKGEIAEEFGLSRQRIIQIANARKKEGTLGVGPG